MRKLALAFALLLMLPAVASAWDTSPTELDWDTFECRNTTGDYQRTEIPTDLIVAGTHRIIGISIMVADTTAHSELVLSVRDRVPDGEGGTVGEVVTEAEAVDHSSEHVWFSMGKAVHTQIIIAQGANTDVQIHYAK